MNTIRTMIKKRQEEGFSLVEMAIVLVIIGLIVSAIAVGRSTMKKGEATKIYQQFINPWIQNSLSAYNNLGASGLTVAQIQTQIGTAQKDLQSTYSYAGTTVTKNTNTVATNTNILAIHFTKSTSLDPEADNELMGVMKNALSTASKLTYASGTAAFSVEFVVPALNQYSSGTAS